MSYITSKKDVMVIFIGIAIILTLMISIHQMQSIQLPEILPIDHAAIIQSRMQQVREPTPKEIEWIKLIEMPLNTQITIHEYKITSVPGGWLYDKEGYQPIFIQDRFNSKRD